MDKGTLRRVSDDEAVMQPVNLEGVCVLFLFDERRKHFRTLLCGLCGATYRLLFECPESLHTFESKELRLAGSYHLVVCSYYAHFRSSQLQQRRGGTLIELRIIY